MSDLSNALQGKLNSRRKSHIKDPDERQLDLFSSLVDRTSSGPKIVQSKPDSSPELRPEPELILPPAGNPPDVAADVRAVLSESGPARPVEPLSEAGESRPPLRTGVYHRPRYSPPPPQATPPPSRSRIPWMGRIRHWFAGVEMDRRMLSLVVVLTVLVALIAFWTACPRGGPVTADDARNLGESLPATEESPVFLTPAASLPVVAAMPAPAAKPEPVVPGATDWTIPGTETVINKGAVLVRFSDPVFVSADKISVEGWAVLKAVAAKLVSLGSGARVIVTGYTDDVPLSKPTAQFKSNADIAEARAKVAVEHLTAFARAGKGLAFEARTGEPSQAPYPNDSPQNRRLNRTVTLQVIPAR